MYTTKAHLIEIYGAARLVELTDRATPAAGEIDDDILDKAIADASALIDGYLAPKYKLPLSETPDLLKQMAAQIAYYKLHIETAPEKIADDYKTTIRTLEWLASGKMKLNIAGAEPPTQAVGEAAFTANDRVDISDYGAGA